MVYIADLQVVQEYRLVGLLVKVSAWRAEDPGFKSCLRWDFSRSSRTIDLKIDPARHLTL